MIHCLIGLIIILIVARVVLYASEPISISYRIYTLIRLLVGLLILLWLLGCLGILPEVGGYSCHY